MNDNICSAFWNHQFTDGTGRIKPCCRFVLNKQILTSGTISENFYSHQMNTLRVQSRNGEKIDGCIRCIEEEESGKKSLRQRYNENTILNQINLDVPTIQWLELAISNECNLACRMCDTKYSNKWYKEELALRGKAHETTKINVEDIYQFVSTLKHLKITGGEPFVTPDHWKLLDYIIKSGYSKNIYLNYSTNCTVYPKEEIVSRLKQFRHVELVISMDSINKEEFEYLRYPSNYDSILINIQKFHELQSEFDLRLQARPTISLFNIMYLPETLTWLDDRNIKYNTTHLTYPDYLRVSVLPDSAKELIARKFNNFGYKNNNVEQQCSYIKNYMLNNNDQHLQKNLLKVTNFLDQSRNQNYKKIYSYLKDINVD